MREIRFRGKRVDNGEWVYGVPLNAKEICNNVTDKGYMIILNEKYSPLEQINYLHDQEGFSHLEDSAPKVIPETVGQYIDKKDKFGIELYEGDVIKSSDNVGPIVYGKPEDMTINCDEYSVDYLGFYLDVPETDLEDRAYCELWEKIGNIHDKKGS